jgi:hypothetical protein
VLGRNTWVGARAIVLKGTTIGDDSVVGSGSVVRGEVPAGVVVAGNPAVVVKTFSPEQRSAPTGPPHAQPSELAAGPAVAPLAVEEPAVEEPAVAPPAEPRVPEQRILGAVPAFTSAPHRSGPNGQVP